MSSKNYVRHLLLDAVYDGDFDQIAGGKWLPSDEMIRLFHLALQQEISKYGYQVGSKYSDLVDSFIDEVRQDGVLRAEGDEFTGEYLSFTVADKDAYVKKAREANDASIRIERLGEEALTRALIRIAELDGWDSRSDDESPPLDPEFTEQLQIDVPASDRIVRLDDNAQTRDDLVEKLEELEVAIRGENDPDGKLENVRERLGVEVRAGRELLKGPTVRVRALWIVLGSALTFIASEFAGGLIGQLAVDLLEALKPLLGL